MTFDPRATDGAVAEAETDLQAGLERSRSGFVARLHGLLAGGEVDEDA